MIAMGVSLAQDSAPDLSREARKAERAGEIAKAYLLYAEAAAADPKNPKYWQQSKALQTQAIIEAKVMPPAGASLLPEDIEGITVGDIATSDLLEARRPQPPRRLKAPAGEKSFDTRGDLKQLWEQMARAWQLDVIFDGDYQPGTPIHFQIDNADYRGAFRALMAATGSFIVPISERVFLVAKDTTAKRTELEPHMAVTVPIPEPFSVQEVQDVARMVQQVAEIPKFAIDTGRRLVFFRDRVSKVRIAQSLFSEVMQPRAQVLVEVDLFDYSRSTTLDYGMGLPGNFPLVYLGTFRNLMRSIPSIPSGVTQLLTFGAGKTFIGFGITNAQVFAQFSKSEGQTLLHTELRALDGSAAQFHVGDKYPVMTTGYFGAQAAPGQQTYTPPPTFSFEDLGLVLKVTPHLLKADELTLDVDSDFKVLTGQALNGIPVIAARKFQSSVSLKEGQSAVLAGLLSSTEARSISGIAGLSSIPVLGRLMRTNSNSEERREVMVVLTPHLITLPPSESDTPRFYSGTDTKPLDPL